MQNIHVPSGAELSLNHAKHAIDRGYWSFKVINLLAEVGPQVFGTVKRCTWFLHTYRQILKKNNNRILFEENTMCLVKMKKFKLNNNALRAIGILCRNGHGSITLAMDSRGHENIAHYDSNIELDALHKKMERAPALLG